MSKFIEQETFFLTAEQQQSLARILSQPNYFLSSRNFAVQLGVDSSRAFASMISLNAAGICEMSVAVYHNCSEAPVAAIPFSIPLLAMPYECPYCEQIVEDDSDLFFELIATENPC